MNQPARAPASTLDRDQLAALVDGRHPDVFALLGIHENPGGRGVIVRALLPGATAVSVIARDSRRKIAALHQVHPGGLFERCIQNRSREFDYLLAIDYRGHRVVQEDPYRFPSCLSPDDLYLFSEGTQERAYRVFGAHARQVEGVEGVLFAVWAPSAQRVSVVGDFNFWDGRRHVMRLHPGSGVWEIFIPDVHDNAHYKFEIVAAGGEVLPLKSDPFARSMQHPPQTASRVVLDESYPWRDEAWMTRRAGSEGIREPMSIYEVHLASWRRRSEQGNRYLSYRELAEELIPYVLDMGFTHIELMPVSEYPFDGSWGYQPVGMYAPSIRFGTPWEFKYFVDHCHQAGLGVLLDWVPGHFPADAHGLGAFDGSCLYEHADKRRGLHPDWNTLIYNYGRAEVISYLVSNAMYWLDEYHIDGLRVDAVASMLYLDYSREDGEWLPNREGGRENLEAIDFLRNVNSRSYFNRPGIAMIAEESTAWPGVSKPVSDGGLGFGYKWNMGWMNDTLRYMARDPVHRRYHHNEMTFGIAYAWSENFVLPLSHDEVVHGKRSLLEKMPGDEWQQFANLRAYLGFMWGHPGKKLLFMGGEFAQRREWDHDHGLDWQLLEQVPHRGMQQLVRDLNHLYTATPALYERDCEAGGFEWLQVDNAETSVFAWLRRATDGAPVIVVRNFTPTVPYDGRPVSISVTVPPLATLVLEPTEASAS